MLHLWPNTSGERLIQRHKLMRAKVDDVREQFFDASGCEHRPHPRPFAGKISPSVHRTRRDYNDRAGSRFEPIVTVHDGNDAVQHNRSLFLDVGMQQPPRLWCDIMLHDRIATTYQIRRDADHRTFAGDGVEPDPVFRMGNDCKVGCDAPPPPVQCLQVLGVASQHLSIVVRAGRMI